VGDPTQQQHDWEPGIKPSGLFWTVPISPSAINVNAHKGRARLRARHVAVSDFHDFFNSISPNPTVQPAHVSFDVQWPGGGPTTTIHDDTFGFSGRFVESNATIEFTAVTDNSSVIYRSDSDGQTNFAPAGVGRERNGVFFH